MESDIGSCFPTTISVMNSVLLPYELIRLIFELAASENRQTTFNLILVSHASHNWCVPSIYHYVFLTLVRLERQLYTKVHLLCQADQDAFERSRIARDDDAFIASAVKQLYITPNEKLLSVCTNITHLSLQPYADEDFPTLISLRHLENLKYLALGFDSIISTDTSPPNITHLQLYHGASFQVPAFTHVCPALSHIMIDWTIFNYFDPVTDYLEMLMDSLPPQHLHFVVTLYDTMSSLTQDEMRFLKEQYPRLFLVDGRPGPPLQNTIKCDASLISEFEFWDEVEERI